MQGSLKTVLFALICVVTINMMGCSGKKIPGQPFVIPFESNYITTEKKLIVAPTLFPDGSSERNFLSITQQSYFFENGNSTAKVQVLLNRKAQISIPQIGEWSTVSQGNCFSGDEGVQCFTAHIDCHLVRTTYIPTGERSLTIIKIRNRAREPQELCEQWAPTNLTEVQQEEVNEFNKVSDSFFSYALPKPVPETKGK